MQFTLKDIADSVNGRLVGSPRKLIYDICLPCDANIKKITLASSNYSLKRLEIEPFSEAGAIIVPEHCDSKRANIIKVSNPELAFAKVILLFYPEEAIRVGISPEADIHRNVKLGKNVSVASSARIGARTVINDRAVIQHGVFIGDDVTVGRDTVLANNVIVLSRTHIGSRVVIQPGSLIGGDGFGYIEDGDTLFKIPHVGRVVIEDDVHVGAHNTIEKANLGQTLIRHGVKTGNFVYIGHNASIGENTRIGGQSGVAGNTVVGKNVVIGPQSGIDQELVIGDYAKIGPKSAILKDVGKGENSYGSPGGMSRWAWLRSVSLVPRLSEMQRSISQLSEQVCGLETKLKNFHEQ